MIGLILLAVMNIGLFYGEVRGEENLLNVAVFVMWIFALVHILGMFASDNDLLKIQDKPFLLLWTMRILTVVTIFHSVYWGYIVVPALWTLGVLVRWSRLYELNNRTRY